MATTRLWLLTGILLAFRLPSPAAASCNALPPGRVVFRGARGTIDRPFVRDGDVITLTPACGSQAFPDTSGLRVTIIAKSPAKGSLQIDPKAGSTPDLQFQVPKGKLGFAGPVAVAVTSAAEPPPPSDLSQKPCRDFLQRSDLFICIDELFTSDGGSCGHDADPVFAAMTALTRQNDFQQMCEDKNEDPQHRCMNDRSYAVNYTLDTSGNVLLSMSWEKVLRSKSGGAKDRRYVQGSAIEAFLSSGSPIDVPSAAFLDSFNAVGMSFDAKPLFLPGVLPEPTAPPGQTVTPGQTGTPTPKEVAFYGTADRDESVLRIARRKLWDYACDAGLHKGQACEPQPLGQPQDCPENPPTDPTATCAKQSSASYFACDQGQRDKRPCTRPQHCPGGACQRLTQLYCSTLSGGQTAKPCSTDSDCDPGQDCGLWLFNLSRKLVNGIGTIPRDKYHGKAHHYAP